MSATSRSLALVGILAMLVGSSHADDLLPPPWPRLGAANFSTAAEWEFFTDPGSSPFVADGVEVPLVVGDGIGGMPPQVLLSGDVAHVPYDGDGGILGGANGIGPGALNFRVGNWIDLEPVKFLRIQMTYDPGPAGLSPNVEFIIPDVSDTYTVTPGAINDFGPIDASGRFHRLEEWEIRPNPDFESIQVFVPEGVIVDQVVIDTISTVPEPSTLVLMACLGVIGLLACRYREG